jgi:hypothetical protein
LALPAAAGTFTAIVLALAGAATAAQESDGAEVAVRAVMKLYTDGTFEGDAGKLRQAFHPKAVMNGYLQGRPTLGGPEPFIARMERSRMKDSGAPYKPEIAHLEIQGKVAQVTLNERGFMGNGEFTNYFHLIDDGSGWKIISKTFTSLP